MEFSKLAIMETQPFSKQPSATPINTPINKQTLASKHQRANISESNGNYIFFIFFPKMGKFYQIACTPSGVPT